MALTWFDAARIALKRPGVVTHRLRLIWSNPYLRRRRISWLCKLTAASPDTVQKYIDEIEQDTEFLRNVRNAYRRHTLYFPLTTDFMVDKDGSTMFFHCVSLYAFIRLIQPRLVVETGGTPGKTSAFILRALRRNRHGHLYTIDLSPPEVSEVIKPNEATTKRPYGSRTNWCVPELLQDRQTLLLGPAEEHLPRILAELGKICMFHHDSDHSYKHMRWELETAYPFVRAGGFLWADDIGTNMAWWDFCAAHKLVSYDFTSQGTARKGNR